MDSTLARSTKNTCHLRASILEWRQHRKDIESVDGFLREYREGITCGTHDAHMIWELERFYRLLDSAWAQQGGHDVSSA